MILKGKIVSLLNSIEKYPQSIVILNVFNSECLIPDLLKCRKVTAFHFNGDVFVSIFTFPDHDPFLIESKSFSIFQCQKDYAGFDLEFLELFYLVLLN